MNDELRDTQFSEVDRELTASFGPAEVLVLPGQHDALSLKRYLYEQTFVGDDGGLEQYATAVVSIIGNDPLTDFEGQLCKFNYDGCPGINKCFVSGMWSRGDSQALPTFHTGLILLSIFSPAAMRELRAEMRRYQESKVFAIIGLPADAGDARSIVSALTEFGEEAHFIQMAPTDGETPVIQTFGEFAIHYVEATLAALTYPGLICVDPGDAITIFSSGKFTRIIRYEAENTNDLLRIGYTTLETVCREVGVISALFAPPSLRLRDIHDVMNLVKSRRTNDRSTVIFAASSNERRSSFVLYIATCE